MLKTPDEVVAFWKDAGPALWFSGGESFDARCREALLELHLKAARAQLAHWVNRPADALALVLLLDQIPRNVYRGSAHAYATDPLARSVARFSMDQNHDEHFDVELRSFFYMPFMHSEALEDQELCVSIFRRIPQAASAPWAEHHGEIIRRFGRFPHRNVLLGRTHTREEEAWLAAGGFQG